MTETTPNPYDVITNFLREKNIQFEEILFACVAGSTMYNLSLPNKSDHDFMAIYRASTHSLLSLNESQPASTVVNTDPDISVLEIGRFCETLQSGSPVVLQTVMIDPKTYPLCYVSEKWHKLRELRPKLITTSTIQSYIGYVKNELKQIQGKSKRDYQKCLYHAFRLLFELKRIINGELPIIRFERHSEEWNFLMEVRTHVPSETQLNKYLREVKTKLDEIEKKSPWTDIVPIKSLKQPGTENYDALNEWLLYVRGI
jgi:predicted nucleotidyltransferase